VTQMAQRKIRLLFRQLLSLSPSAIHPAPTRPQRIRARQHDDDDYDDYERSSLCSSQTGSTRIRLQERWRIVGTKDKATCNPENITRWIEDHAHAEMAKAGQFEDLRPAHTDVGGFQVHM
jgi:hypothetical protein